VVEINHLKGHTGITLTDYGRQAAAPSQQAPWVRSNDGDTIPITLLSHCRRGCTDGLDLADALETAGFFAAGPLTSGQIALGCLARFGSDVVVAAPVLKNGSAEGLISDL
jgi:hypothetical protein